MWIEETKKFTFQYVSINTSGFSLSFSFGFLFTFQYVSINTSYLQKIIAFSFSFTFQYVSINTNHARKSGGIREKIYIPICFY